MKKGKPIRLRHQERVVSMTYVANNQTLCAITNWGNLWYYNFYNQSWEPLGNHNQGEDVDPEYYL